jgi:hypothetical protein
VYELPEKKYWHIFPEIQSLFRVHPVAYIHNFSGEVFVSVNSLISFVVEAGTTVLEFLESDRDCKGEMESELCSVIAVIDQLQV